MVQNIRDSLIESRPFRRSILATLVLAHGLGLLLWAMSPPPPLIEPPTALQLVFITMQPTALAPPSPPPPLAQPIRRESARLRSVQAPEASIAPLQIETPTTGIDEAAPRADSARILGSLQAVISQRAEIAPITKRDPTRRYAADLPGRTEPFTPTAVTLRRQITPEDVVKAIGVLFGANHNPCPDTRGKIADLVARNERIGEAELHTMIDQERRLCR